MSRPSPSRSGHLAEVLVVGLLGTLAVVLFFLPALLAGGSLAPGDGSVAYLPNFYRGDASMWTDDIYGGYAAGLDPQFQLFYLPFWLTTTYPQFVLLAYVAAAIGAYGCARSLDASYLGAVLAALIFAFGGFMTAHLGHVTIVHAAAWIPWLLWAVHALSHMRSLWPLLGGAMATWMCIGGGHPQISIYGLLLAGCYALSRLPALRGQRLPFLVRLSAMFGLGLILSAPILAGFYAASVDAVRGAWTEADFNSFSYSLPELALLLFPNVHGSMPDGPYGTYTGPYNLTELAAYVGWLPWLLVPLLLVARDLRTRTAFWLIAAAISLLLMLGTATPLGQLVFESPVLGQFRAQARFGILLCVCLAMATALAVTALERGEAMGPLQRPAFWLGAFVVLGSAALYAWRQSPWLDDASMVEERLWLPLGLALVTLMCLAFLVHGRRPWALALLPFLLIGDLASFGRHYQWRSAPLLSSFTLTAESAEYLRRIVDSGARVLPRDDALAYMTPSTSLTPLTPNINRMHGVPVVTGYGPLADPVYLKTARATTSGGATMPRADAAILDVLRVGWIAGDPGRAQSQLIGSGCGAEGATAAVGFDIPEQAQWLRLVTHLACSVGMGTGAPAAKLIETDSVNQELLGLLRAGMETGEWAHARPDVANEVKHPRPVRAIPFDAGGFPGHWYIADLALPRSSIARSSGSARTLVLESMVPGTPVRIQSSEFSLDGRTWQPVAARPLHADVDQHFSELPPIEGLPPLLQRQRMPPRFWSPCRIEIATVDEITGRLWAGGKNRLDVSDTLLVTAEAGLAPARCDGDRVVELVDEAPGKLSLEVGEGTPRALVIATTFHRGWKASANGEPLPVFRAYGLNLGVLVPAGTQRIEFEFAPPELSLGLGLLLLGLVCVAALLLLLLRRSSIANRSGASP
jgi:hypothetical protein